MGMVTDIDAFIDYLKNTKKLSENTLVSYRRDLMQLFAYLEGQNIREAAKATRTCLNSYLLHLEKEGKAATTISRMLASVKAYYRYELMNGQIARDPAELLKAPRVEKKPPAILTVEEVDRFLMQPTNKTAKEIRDKAMLELLYATGIRVSELICLKLSDINLPIGFITCQDGVKQRMIPFGKTAGQSISNYLAVARPRLLKGRESELLFTNCKGQPMSRQGFWKIVKFYGDKAGIEADITPHTLRHSFAAHLLSGGADMQAVQAMLGHADLSSTLMYQNYIRREPLQKAYAVAHPRK